MIVILPAALVRAASWCFLSAALVTAASLVRAEAPLPVVKIGVAGVRQLLQAGCNDLGGTLMGENISRAAGASHGQGMTEDDFRTLVEPLGRPLEQRTTLYGRVPRETVGV